MRKTRKQSLTVSKTISMPIDLLNGVLDEAEIMGKDFSPAVQVLLATGIAIRKEQRARELDREAKLLKGERV